MKSAVDCASLPLDRSAAGPSSMTGKSVASPIFPGGLRPLSSRRGNPHLRALGRFAIGEDYQHPYNVGARADRVANGIGDRTEERRVASRDRRDLIHCLFESGRVPCGSGEPDQRVAEAVDRDGYVRMAVEKSFAEYIRDSPPPPGRRWRCSQRAAISPREPCALLCGPSNKAIFRGTPSSRISMSSALAAGARRLCSMKLKAYEGETDV